MITRVLTDDSGRTGVYYDEKGGPMNGSAQVRDPEFSERVVAETRALLARVPRENIRPVPEEPPRRARARWRQLQPGQGQRWWCLPGQGQWWPGPGQPGGGEPGQGQCQCRYGSPGQPPRGFGS